MPGNAVQWKSCPRGHNYLGDVCPCEQANRYGPKIQEMPRSEKYSDSQLGTEIAQRPK